MFETIKTAVKKLKDTCEDASLGILGIIGVIIGLALIFGIAFGLISFVVWIAMLLWNGVLRDLFPVVPEVTFWQMWGLYLLSNILFKSSSSSNSKSE